MYRSVLKKVLYALEIVLALASFYGGWALLSDPTGNSLSEPAAMFLMGTPFESYLVPGLVLFVVNGAFPLLVVVACSMDQSWAKWGHIAVGALLCLWMAVQMVMVGMNTTLQFAYMVLGIAILVLALVVRPRDVTPPKGLTPSN